MVYKLYFMIWAMHKPVLNQSSLINVQLPCFGITFYTLPSSFTLINSCDCNKWINFHIHNFPFIMQKKSFKVNMPKHAVAWVILTEIKLIWNVRMNCFKFQVAIVCFNTTISSSLFIEPWCKGFFFPNPNTNQNDKLCLF